MEKREDLVRVKREDRDREKIERDVRRQFEEEADGHHYLPLFVVQLPQGNCSTPLNVRIPTRFCSKVLQQY